MGVKHKKTRKEKIIADHRHQTPIPAVPVAAINTNPYPYVFRDVLRTGILTLSIIMGQIILFFLLKNHMISLPGINY